MRSRVVMGTRLRYSVWKVYPPQMSQTISAARKSSLASPQVLLLSHKPNGQRQRIDHFQRRNYVPNSKRTRPSWEHMKPPHLRPPIQIRVPCMQPHRRHMSLPQHRPLRFLFLLFQWSPQVRPPPSPASHRLRAFSQEHLPSRRSSLACPACLLGMSFTT